MSGLFGLGGSWFFSVRESQLRPEPATWVRKAWRHHFVCSPGPRQAHNRKTSLGSVCYCTRAAGAGMGCSIVSAMHHGRLGTTMGSRHSSGADLLLSHSPTMHSLVNFHFPFWRRAAPRHRRCCQRSTASNAQGARVSTAGQ